MVTCCAEVPARVLTDCVVSVMPRHETHALFLTLCCVRGHIAVWVSSKAALCNAYWLPRLQQLCLRSADVCFPSQKDKEQSPEPSNSRGARGHHRTARAAAAAAASEIRAAGAGRRRGRKTRGCFSAAKRQCPGDKSSQRAAKSKQGAASQAITQ